MAHWTAAAALTVIVLLAGCIAGSEGDSSNEDENVGLDATPEPEAVEWGSMDSAFIRPGAPIGWCTYNFLFVDPAGEDGNGTPTYYIGTAAHCVDDVDQRIPLAGQGEIGEVAWTSNNETTIEDDGVDSAVDFALVRLDDGLNLDAHPRMMNTDGPTGYATASDVEMGDELEHHGYGMGFGELEPTRDRPGWLVSFDKDYCSESAIWWGDSGSPVIHSDTQLALGIVSRAGWTSCTPTSQLRGATLPYIFEELAKTDFDNVRLALEDGTYSEPFES